MKQVKRKLLTINGPEFSNEKHGSAGLCSSKVPKSLQMVTSHLPVTTATARCGKNLVTRQARGIAMLLGGLYPCQNGLVVDMLHAVEKTSLLPSNSQPKQVFQTFCSFKGSKKVIFLDTSLGFKNPGKNRLRHRGPPQWDQQKLTLNNVD